MFNPHYGPSGGAETMTRAAESRRSLPGKVMRGRLCPHRQALSLVELLVVIAVIGTLIALMLPAVSAQRETARKTQCVSRLRQAVIGLHAYHEAHSSFPPGHVAEVESGFEGKSWGWGALLLPFVEQQTLSDRLDPTKRSLDEVASDPERAWYLLSNVDLYRCPSDVEDELSHRFRPLFVPLAVRDQLSWSQEPRRVYAGRGLVLAHISPPPPPPPDQPLAFLMGVRIARSNYVACIGSQWKLRQVDWSNADFEGNGLFGRNSDVRQSEISDGASKTIAIGERCDRNYAAVWAGGNTWNRCGFADNQMVLGTAFYPINDAPTYRNVDCDGEGSVNFSSYHHGGANFAFADGSVRFLVQTIDSHALRRLARRDDGENPGDF